MSSWHDYVQMEGKLPEWPYTVNYGKENEIDCDVLIIGGGVAGCRAAISAARHGAKVTVVDRGHAKRSGAGGAGVDHWHGAVTNPCSKVTPMDYTLACFDSAHGYTNGIARYIINKEGWDTLQECEEMGVQIRDVNDEFKGAPFRDEETKLMFAYDYTNRHVVRIWGYNIKPAIYAEMLRLGIKVCNRIMVTSLLTEKGKQGNRVIGATGVNTRSGEYYIFSSKATIIYTGGAGRLFNFAPEVTASNSMSDMNSSGTGQALGWKARAEFVLMEQVGPGRLSGYGYAPYSMGNTHNTYHGVSIVDAEGKEVPWVDVFGKPLSSVEERFRPAQNQPFQLATGIGLFYYLDQFRSPDLIRDLPERIRKGEYKLPLFADLSRLSEDERHCIFGMMVGNEGKTRIPIYDKFTRAGFNPDTDLLQAPVMPPENYQMSNLWGGPSIPYMRTRGGGGFLVDWELRTSLEGLYAAGGAPLFGSGCHGESHTTGRYAGRQAALYARTVKTIEIDRRQVKLDKEQTYLPIGNDRQGIGWKELNHAISRVMTDYCGKYKNETTLKSGLRLLNELKGKEAAEARASNPHELGRTLECYSLISLGEIVFEASLARKCSSLYLDFNRLDYPEMDPKSWAKLLPIKKQGEGVKVRELPLDYHLKPPYAPEYEDNYRVHSKSGSGKQSGSTGGSNG
jgi:succinate dehydrogenase/fumarate reductase flavoprotein subunit